MEKKNNTWTGHISNVRISETADKELFEDLKNSNHRERSRRLRTLATVGLYALSQKPTNSQGLAQKSLAALDKAMSNLDSSTVTPGRRSSVSKLSGSL